MSSSSVPRHRRRRGEFSAKAAKHKWDSLEKNVSAVVNKKQTITNIEKDMDVWLKVQDIYVDLSHVSTELLHIKVA